ncbi:helix-turn-helix domain-containing protein [Testudinibacter aquarius]|uniref:Putative XRE-type DNA-binding protein n=1 Tax=Testudinibacter aquarius TaxID=1524974 RepID=A0A4R3Y059_9PAST|nr:XRE family transcriptional regulator [Testudinibacter aquarius]TNG90206.1 XRE family transcriptional regulator [Pasteurellaceae bacterium USgator41]TNG93392.1 XRE family transcriptional regulator [Pasteurellaceae bacterium UScroc12]TNG99226.1 XRE family transcriptional regulator [Pasteurellaceae bacterium UScroc31]TNG99235.1 XRE family transcriptional regulator [Pasteurellaceae bacterium USgator11]KAE9526458.1 XRE family transcriptional regulator [Testudinibacter aquarius]
MSDKITHITPANGNIFLDLGFPDNEAASLKAHSQAVIEMKLTLVEAMDNWIQENQLKQADAANILGVTRPRISDMVNRKIGKFTIDSLLTMLAKTNKSAHLSIR